MGEQLELWAGASLDQIDTTTLVAARTVIQGEAEFQDLFRRAYDEKWHASKIAQALEARLPEFIDRQGIHGVAWYLAEEFLRADREQLLLLSPQTGLPLAQLPRDAFELTPSGKMLRLKPDIEAALTQKIHQAARETREHELLAKRARRTDFLKTSGDNRLSLVTRSGRAKLIDRLREDLPKILSGPGVLDDVLERCRIVDKAPGDCTCWVECELDARVAHSVPDFRSLNFRFDFYQGILERVRAQWVRSLVSRLGLAVHDRGPVEPGEPEKEQGVIFADPSIIIGPPRILEGVPIPGCRTVLLHPEHSIYIMVDAQKFKCNAIERQSAWEVCAVGHVTLAWHPDAFTALTIDAPVPEVKAEIL